MTESSTARLLRWSSWLELEAEPAAAELARFVRGGGVVVFPTESSYALGADPQSSKGVAAVFRIKGRPADKPLPVVVSALEALARLGVDGTPAESIGLTKAWPGPLTVVLPCETVLPAACGRRELAIRIPGHSRLRALLARAGVSLTATSANETGAEPLLAAREVARLTGGERVLVIDEGRLAGARPSTVVRIERDVLRVLRAGAVSIETLRGLVPDSVRVEEISAEPVEIPVEESG